MEEKERNIHGVVLCNLVELSLDLDCGSPTLYCGYFSSEDDLDGWLDEPFYVGIFNLEDGAHLQNVETLKKTKFYRRTEDLDLLLTYIVDHCKLVLKFPNRTNSSWYNEQFNHYEPLEYSYDVCEALLLWEQDSLLLHTKERSQSIARPSVLPIILECLGVIRIHSPLRAERFQYSSDVPSRETITRAHIAALRLKRSKAGEVGDLGPFGSCKLRGHADLDGVQVSGSPDMSDTQKNSNYSRLEVLPFKSLREETQEHFIQMGGVSMYKMDGSKLDDLVCVKHTNKSDN